jgi:hypothetical protein
VQAVGGDVQNVLDRVAPALEKWARVLESAQDTDAAGVAVLNDAESSLGFLGVEVWNLPTTVHEALEGVNLRITAAQQVRTTGTQTASRLNQLADQARAERVSGGGIDPSSAVLLATEIKPGGDGDGGRILTENQLTRGSQVLDRMDAPDQVAFQKLLARPKSPEEAAYLWKALASGQSLNQVQRFDAAIHPHGDDATWLGRHVAPDLVHRTLLPGAGRLRPGWRQRLRGGVHGGRAGQRRPGHHALPDHRRHR